jgi:hypothetical protein
VSATVEADKLNAGSGVRYSFAAKSLTRQMLSPCLSSDQMNASEKPRWLGIPMISSEALLGIGITVAELGILCLLLGWAEYMRSVRQIAMIWAGLGIVLVITGGFIAAVPRMRDRRRLGADRLPPSTVPPEEAPKASEAEEQLY